MWWEAKNGPWTHLNPVKVKSRRLRKALCDRLGLRYGVAYADMEEETRYYAVWHEDNTYRCCGPWITGEHYAAIRRQGYCFDGDRRLVHATYAHRHGHRGHKGCRDSVGMWARTVSESGSDENIP